MTDRTINLTDAEDIVRHECGAWTGLAETIVRRFKKLPTVDAVTVRHGQWKHKVDLKQFFCDQCGEPSLTEDDVYFYGMEFPNFCPNCGADMRKEGDHEKAD